MQCQADQNCFPWVSEKGFSDPLGERPALLHGPRGISGKDSWEEEKWEASGEALAGILGVGVTAV